MKLSSRWIFVLLVTSLLLSAAALQAEDVKKFSITGVNYTKWLWGNQRLDGGLYNYSDVPGEGYGDNGQGTELELLVSARPSKKVEVSGRMKARFNQNFWTNFGGFGGGGVGAPGSGDCVGGDCGEHDSRSAQYIKFRGLTITMTPGYKWVDTITVGSSDFGMFDPFTIGKIRYIDRDNGAGLIFQGGSSKVHYDVVRVSLPRLWAGPDFNTGDYNVADAAYAVQIKVDPSSKFDLGFVYEYVNDIEVDATDFNPDNGRDIRTRFRNDVLGLRLGFHPSSVIDVKGAFYSSSSDANPDLSSASFFGISGFSPVPAGQHDDEAYKVDVDINDPFGNGLSFNLEYFDIGAEFVSVMAARRESDVLLTEGHDGAFALPGPSNAAYGVFGGLGNETKIGYGGWQGNAQQVATINADNAFTDFDEAMAETVIGWKGFTIRPTLGVGDLDLSAEYTTIDYNTNWQAWNDPTRAILNSLYPNMESDAGFGSPRNAYAPFQDKNTDIYVLKLKYFIDVGSGLELHAKVKMIDEQDKRLNDPRFLPYQPGDCPGGGAPCANNLNYYGSSPDGALLSSADLYGNPPVIVVGAVAGYQWAPFDDISDDDRDLDYKLYQLGFGYQLTSEVYATITYEHYDVDLKDGNTAFQAYQLHEMASGEHTKDKLILTARYNMGGAEIGFNYEYNTGTFKPDFGDGFVVQFADAVTAASVLVPVDSPGFRGRFGGWNSLLERDYDHQRFKAYLKVFF